MTLSRSASTELPRRAGSQLWPRCNALPRKFGAGGTPRALLSLLAHGNPRRKEAERARPSAGDGRWLALVAQSLPRHGRGRMASRADRTANARLGDRKTALDSWKDCRGGASRPHARSFVPARPETSRMTRPNAVQHSQDAPDDSPLSDSEFKALLADVIPHLRAYGRSLSGNPDLADDLTQDTMVKASASRDRFDRGTSIKAWTFVILRNTFLSQMRRNKFRGEYDEGAVERTLSTPAA